MSTKLNGNFCPQLDKYMLQSLDSNGLSKHKARTGKQNEGRQQH